MTGTLAHAMATPGSRVPNVYPFPLTGVTDGHQFRFAPANNVFSEQDQGLLKVTGQLSGQQFVLAIGRPDGTGYTLPMVETTPDAVITAEGEMAATCSKPGIKVLPADADGRRDHVRARAGDGIVKHVNGQVKVPGGGQEKSPPRGQFPT